MEQGEPKPIRILIVDDEPMVREVVVLYLRDGRHEVTEAEDAAQALEKFQSGTFDVVLTDRSMPGMSGDELAVRIKQIAPRCPVVLLTGYQEAAAGRSAVDFVLPKPFAIDALRDVMRKALRR
jgi:CheY-like chemotaxis protein